MSLIESIKQDFTSHVQDNVREIKVPEWNDATIYVYPMNLEQQERLAKLIEKQEMFEAVVEIIVMRAKDEKGVPYFGPKDKEVLRKQSRPEVLARVAEEIVADVNTEPADVKIDSAKNA